VVCGTVRNSRYALPYTSGSQSVGREGLERGGAEYFPTDKNSNCPKSNKNTYRKTVDEYRL
jgi:hypothetical protein